MTEVRESPSGPLIDVGGGGAFIAGTILFPAGTVITSNNSQEETFDIGPNPDTTAQAQQWSVVGSQVPSDDGVTNLLNTGLVCSLPAVVLGEDAVFRVRISISNPSVGDQTLESDILFFVVASQIT